MEAQGRTQRGKVEGLAMSTDARVKVYVHASDPVSATGVAGELRLRPEVLVVDEAECDMAHVAVVVADEVDSAAARTVRAVQRDGCGRVVMVVTRLDDA